MDGHRRALELMSATWTRVIRSGTSAIPLAGSTGGGGSSVAFVWTWRDGLRVAVVLAVEGGEKGGGRAFLVVATAAMQGTGGLGF